MRSNILYMHETGLIAGGERSLLALIENLDKSRFGIFVACPGSGPLKDRLGSLRVRVHDVDFPRIRNIAGVRGAVDKLRRIIKNEDIALIHSNSIRTHIYAWLAGYPGRIPMVWHERNLIDKERFDPDRLLSFLPDAIICNSRAIAARFMRRGAVLKKVSVIHNGVDLERFSPQVSGEKLRARLNIGTDEIVIGVASRFNISKGHEVFLSAASSLLSADPEARRRLRFLISGGAVFAEDAERESALKELAARCGVADRVIFTGFVDNMPEVYAAADIMVAPAFGEACGRVVSESMAAGRPVIGTRAGGSPEMIVDNVTGIIVQPGDWQGMARAIKTLIDDPDMRARMGRASRQKAEKEFDIKIHAKETEDLYLRTIDRIVV